MVEAALGGGIQIGDIALGAIVDLTASVHELRDVLDRMRQLEEDYGIQGPVQVPLRGVVTTPASGNAVIDLGGPSYGRRWEVRRLVVGGVTFGDSVSGTAEIYAASSAQGALQARSLTDLVDQAATLPLVGFYSAGQLVLRHPQRLCVVLVSPSASTAYAVGGEALATPDAPMRRVVTE